MSVFGQLSFVPDCLHYEHFLSLYQTEVLITATWYGCLLCFHCWLLCDQMLINCWQHKRCLLTLLFSGWIKAFFLVSYMLQALHCLVEPPLDSLQNVSVVLVLWNHIQLVVHQDSQSFSAKLFMANLSPAFTTTWDYPIFHMQDFAFAFD